jgi:pyruvate formate lyase activating enzyme
VHFSRFMPQYQLQNLPPTPIETITHARDLALEAGLRFVYTGNVAGHEGEDTTCPSCGALLIDRLGFYVLDYHITAEGACDYCGEPIPGVWGRVTLAEIPGLPEEYGAPDS